MKPDANTLRLEEQESAAAADPFAVDLFAGGAAGVSAAAGAPPLTGASARAGSWDEALPKVSREEARLSALLAATPASLPDAASAALARSAGQLVNIDAGQAAFEVLETREENLSVVLTRTATPRAFVRLTVEPWEARAVLIIEAAFAAAVVDRMLGGDGTGAMDAPRALSTAERAVLEFFCARLLAGLNEEAGEPLFRLEEVTDEAGEWGDGRAVVTVLRARLGTTAGVVRLAYGAEVLAALDERRSPMLARGGESTKLARYTSFCPGADLSLMVGETEVDAAGLSGLEPGDVVVVERVFGEWDGRNARGALRARVGAGDTVLVEGAAEGVGAGGLRLLVKEVSASEARGVADAGRVRMEDENELGEESGDGAGLLDNLLLTVRVELPARRISLEELTRLRAGQILELDCRATDPVELVADGRRVATGELVDIDGRLGVRVTRLAG